MIVVLVIAIGITITLIVLRKKKDQKGADGKGKGKGKKGGKKEDNYREQANTDRGATQRTQPEQPQVQSTPSRREQQPVMEDRQRETSLRTRNEAQERRQSEVRRQSEARPVIIEANQVNIEEEGSVGADAPVVKVSEVQPTAGPGASQIRNQQRNNLGANRGGGASQVMNQAAPSGLTRKDQVDDDDLL